MISIRIAAVLLLALVVVANCVNMNAFGKRSVSKREAKTDLHGKMMGAFAQPENKLKADATQNNLKAENIQAIAETKDLLKDACSCEPNEPVLNNCSC